MARNRHHHRWSLLLLASALTATQLGAQEVLPPVPAAQPYHTPQWSPWSGTPSAPSPPRVLKVSAVQPEPRRLPPLRAVSDLPAPDVQRPAVPRPSGGIRITPVTATTPVTAATPITADPPRSPVPIRIVPAAQSTMNHPAPLAALPVSGIGQKVQVLRMAAQVKDKEKEAEGEAIPLRITVPEADQVFRLESESDLQARMKREALQKGRELPFPEEPTLPRQPRVPPPAAPTVAVVEPSYLFYHRLGFEQKNSERYGWDLGPIHPLVSAAHFYADVATAPARRLVDPGRCYETNAGYCLPGDPVPCLLPLPRLFGSSSH